MRRNDQRRGWALLVAITGLVSGYIMFVGEAVRMPATVSASGLSLLGVAMAALLYVSKTRVQTRCRRGRLPIPSLEH